MRILSLSALLLAAVAVFIVSAEEDKNNRPLTLVEKNKKVKLAKEKTTKTKSGLETRVVGGDTVTSTSKYKFFVEWEDNKCGASLIHDDIALSAAHCESGTHPFNTRVFVNGIESEKGIFRTVERQVSHPLYHGDQNDYDFMLLKLTASALVDDNGDATTAELVTLNTDPTVPEVGADLKAVGYGVTAEGGSSTSETLQDVTVKYVSDETCFSQYGANTFVPDLMFCAGVEGGGKDTCQGDSGGPIMDIESNTQVGVVSFGIGCARDTHNGVYARVSAVTEWLDSKICELSDFPPEGCPTRPDPVETGDGALTIEVTYDSYARETALSLVQDSTGEPVYFQPYDDPTAVNGQTVTLPFDNLAAGTYTLMIGDDGKDGFCCQYGDGKVIVTDGNGEVVHDEPGDFGQFVRIVFEIDDDGNLSKVSRSTDYDNSWEGAEEVPNYPQKVDQAWPGPKPGSKKDLYINVKFDRSPEETSWTFSKRNGNSDQYQEIESLDGFQDGIHNDLVSVQLNDLDEGWYRFQIEDNGGDGICCSFRRGWASITGYLLATRKSGMVWGSNGEFGDGTEVYLLMNDAGYVKRITTDPSQVE